MRGVSAADAAFASRRATLEQAGQGHLFAGWERRPPALRRRLSESLADLDPGRLRRLQELLRRAGGPAAARPAAPAAPAPAPVREPDSASAARWAARGHEQLARGSWALLTVAGGQGTRLGFDAPKGMFPVTPIRRATLFQVFAEKLLAARAALGAAAPWFIMTSPLNHAATARYFAEHDYFGLPEADVRLFQQGTNPVLSAAGELLLAPDGGLLLSPDGAGGVFAALQHAGLIDAARARGITHLFYFQVDNPLVTVPDASFLGAHLEAGSQFSTKVVAKLHAGERVGVAALVGGRPGIVEYSDLDPALAAARAPDGELRFRYGSIAIHLIDVGFAAARAAALPVHLARKRQPVLRPQAAPGAAEAVEQDVVKFEQFVFDLIPQAPGALFYAVDRAEEFAPLKNRTGADSIATCRAGQIARARRWLRQCGVQVAERARDGAPLALEITPRYAADRQTLQQRLPAAVTRMDDHTLLDC